MRLPLGMSPPTNAHTNQRAPSSPGHANSQHNDDGFIVQPSQDRTWRVYDQDMDWATSLCHDVEAGSGVTCLGSDSSQPIAPNNP